MDTSIVISNFNYCRLWRIYAEENRFLTTLCGCFNQLEKSNISQKIAFICTLVVQYRWIKAIIQLFQVSCKHRDFQR